MKVDKRTAELALYKILQDHPGIGAHTLHSKMYDLAPFEWVLHTLNSMIHDGLVERKHIGSSTLWGYHLK